MARSRRLRSSLLQLQSHRNRAWFAGDDVFCFNGRSMQMKNLIALCKRRGFIFQSSEIYGGLNGFWDYGPLGVELKRNLKDAWWKDLVTTNNELQVPPGASEPYTMVGIDTAQIMHPQVWKVSGHHDLFFDYMVDCKESKRRYRFDQVRGRWVEYRNQRIFVTTIAESEDELADLHQRALKFFKLREKQAGEVQWGDVASLNTIGDMSMVLGPDATQLDTLTEPREFNLMFKTSVGPIGGSEGFLRPETAQGIFINFKNIINSLRIRLPFGVAQIGKSFRNEITPRNYIFRSREFEQMEIEFFCRPDSSQAWYQYWRDSRLDWYKRMGLSSDRLRLREHAPSELSHYSVGTADIEYAFPFLDPGEFGELEGIAHRGDFDLKSHQEGKLDPKTLQVEIGKDGMPQWPGSGKDLSYRDDLTGDRFIPHVIEPSGGVDRALLAFLCDAFREDQVPDENGKLESRIMLALHPRLAPIKAAVFPLVKKPEMTMIATEIYGELKKRFNTFYDFRDSIGRRYRRQDEIGTPYCITVDGQTLQDRTVTIRDRNSLKQRRIRMEDCSSEISKALSD